MVTYYVMGGVFTKLYGVLQSFTTRQPVRIFMLGLDGAGKTTALYRIKLNETVATIPTFGVNIETVTPRFGVTFTVVDVGDREVLRPLYVHYFDCSSGLIFVVDSADRDRLAESRDLLQGLVQSEHLKNVPVVVMANKQDVPCAAKPAEIAEMLGLWKLSGHRWHVEGTSATSGDGLIESMKVMSRLLKESQDNH